MYMYQYVQSLYTLTYGSCIVRFMYSVLCIVVGYSVIYGVWVYGTNVNICVNQIYSID